MSKPPRAKYRTTNWSEYNAALKRRGSLMVWLDADLQWQAPGSGRSGRPAVYSDAAIQFCLTLQCMFGLGLRQATGLAESLIKLARLDWAVPDYSTLSRRQALSPSCWGACERSTTVDLRGILASLLLRRGQATKLETSYNELFESAVTEAQAFEAKGCLKEAATRYSQFLEVCGSQAHRVLTRGEFRRLQCLTGL
jgi:hypothetical protein